VKVEKGESGKEKLKGQRNWRVNVCEQHFQFKFKASTGGITESALLIVVTLSVSITNSTLMHV